MRTATIALILTLGLTPPPPASWHWPVDGEHRVVRDFLAPPSPWGAGHRGLDLAARAGTPVRAPVSGRVSFSGRVVDRGVITIETADGWLVSMEPVEASMSSGQVRAGQRLGVLQSGHCPGGCLHIGLRIEGEYRSPARELGILRRAVLQPLS